MYERIVCPTPYALPSLSFDLRNAAGGRKVPHVLLRIPSLRFEHLKRLLDLQAPNGQTEGSATLP